MTELHAINLFNDIVNNYCATHPQILCKNCNIKEICIEASILQHKLKNQTSD